MGQMKPSTPFEFLGSFSYARSRFGPKFYLSTGVFGKRLLTLPSNEEQFFLLLLRALVRAMEEGIFSSSTIVEFV